MDKHGLKDLDELLEKCQDIEWFWKEMADELLEFYKPYDKVLEWEAPWAKWFVGGEYNIVHDALDRHMKTDKKDNDLLRASRASPARRRSGPTLRCITRSTSSPTP